MTAPERLCWAPRTAWLFLLVASIYTSIMVGHCASAACADEGLEGQILVLQPRLTPGAVSAYAQAFRRAGQESGIRPSLLAVIAYRESSLLTSVAECRVTGTRGELGVMQVMPRGRALRYAPCDDQCRAGCSIRTGAAYLAACRSWCPGSTWRWVAAYGRSTCPSEAEARQDRATRRARALWERIGGGSW